VIVLDAAKSMPEPASYIDLASWLAHHDKPAVIKQYTPGYTYIHVGHHTLRT
jgi:hypothetical protein